jgi:predicted lipid-binding transport protein (Tim44 family)
MIGIIVYIIGFLRTLVLIVVLVLFIRLIKRMFAPSSSNQTQQTNTPPNKEGETTIRFNKKGEKIVDKEKGEYVDFEEVD